LDDFSQDESGKPCRCGQRYDDVERRTIWPHEELPPAGPVIFVETGKPLRGTPAGVIKMTLGTPEAGAFFAQLVIQLREGRRA
jgi:hypothetical protein